jgi:hypothetical protein
MDFNFEINSILLIIFYVLIICQILYIFFTRKSKTIVLRQKFTITLWGFTRYILVDSNYDIYELSDSYWFARQDSINDWIKLKINKKYTIYYYGFTSTSLGTKPQIIDIEY